jgi:hypothetical protein
MNYLSIQTLIAVFQESISLLPLLMAVWYELKINEKLEVMGVGKHHGIPFHENVYHMTYLPFINARSTRQLADNLPYHQRVFTYLWDKVNPIRWWQLIVSVSDGLLFGQKQFPNMAEDGVMLIDDTPMEKFGIHMENISGVRTTKGRIGIGYVAFLACVFLPEIAIPIACRAWVPACVPGYESKVSMAIATVKHFARQAKKAKLSIAGMVVVFDSWYFAVELCRTIDRNRMIWITQSKSNRIFFLPDEKGNPTIKKRASDFIAHPTGKMKPLYGKRVWYHNIGRCYLPRYGWVYATVVYDTRRNPEVFLLVTSNLEANGPWMIEHYYKRWKIETVIRDAKQSLGLPDFHMRHFSGISAHLCVCMLNYITLSWLRYSRKLNLSIGDMVHIIFHELILKAVEEVRHYSLSQEVKLMNWLPIAV